MNLYNVLSNRYVGMSNFERLFAQKFGGTGGKIKELEGVPPLTFTANGQPLLDYRIYGNTENGESVGEQTENLFDKNTITPNSLIIDTTGKVVNYRYYDTTAVMEIENDIIITFVKSASSKVQAFRIAFYDTQNNFISSYHNGNASSPLKVTIPTGTKKVRVSYTNGVYPSSSYPKDLFIGLTAPTSYIPYGYKLAMVVRSENLFDVSKTQSPYASVEGDTIHKSPAGYFYDLNCFTTGANTNGDVNKMIPIKAGTYTVSCTSSSSSNLQIAIRYFDGVEQKYIHSAARLPYSFNVPNDGKISMRVSNDIALDIKGLKICPGSTAPTEYIPYYRDEENIYIGSDPLAEDEYVDFGEQKIYRMEGGTLTPTDPPVPIPALPTIEGETTIEYAGGEPQPTQMYIKYKTRR